mmetsp:Transcript_39794/g.91772  ORF Transcript_39794/g.91772 Transcript_39794/m.91772 type:complete len:526 (-) Transcript_39794:10-1587(-)
MTMYKPLSESQVEALKELSAPMKSSLKLCIFGPHIARYPLFRVWECLDNTSTQLLCDQALRFAFLAPGDILFDHGYMAKKAYMVVEGELAYNISADTMPGSVDVTTVPDPGTADKGAWLCEAALWCTWYTVGAAEANTTVQLLEVDADLMGRIARKKARVRGITADYAKCYHKGVLVSKPPMADWPTDLSVPFTEYEDIVPKMDRDSRALLGRVALSELSRNWMRASQQVFNQLSSDVMKGKCTLVMTITGECVRLVTLAALCLKRPDGRMFVQIGEYADGACVPGCKLPGAKVGEGEQPRDIVDRVLNADLCTISEGISVKNVIREVQKKESKEYGIFTKYLRIIFQATLDEAFTLPAHSVVPYKRDDEKMEKALTSGGSVSSLQGASEGCCNLCWLPKTFKRAEGGNFSQSSVMAYQNLLEQLSLLPVHMLEREGKMRFFAWLHPEEFRDVSERGYGENALAAWLTGLCADDLLQAERTRATGFMAKPEAVADVMLREASDQQTEEDYDDDDPPLASSLFYEV